mmetsp:Transcript_44749/g.91332  ORF Transcript_44749/g.91332 Transcript_44749/m.91332 type:complete len:250 (-) Transcript_44749:2573-3322(-)
MDRGGSKGYDKHITMFSPQGRLFQVEYAFKASQNFGSTCIALKGEDNLCAIIYKKQSENYGNSGLNSSFLSLGNYTGCICTGFPGDIQMQIQEALKESVDFFKTFSYEIPVEDLARKVSGKNQVFTQHAFMRPLGVKTIFLGIDEEMGPQIYKCDPSGYYSSHLVCAIGEKEAQITNYIKKKAKFFNDHYFSYVSTVSKTISILQHVLEADIKTTDITVIVSVKGGYKFRQLSEKEIDHCLRFLGRDTR